LGQKKKPYIQLRNSVGPSSVLKSLSNSLTADITNISNAATINGQFAIHFGITIAKGSGAKKNPYLTLKMQLFSSTVKQKIA